MRRLRQNAQTARGNANDHLDHGDPNRRQNRVQGNRLLLTLHVGGGGDVRHMLRLFTFLCKSANLRLGPCAVFAEFCS
jgi:hypothetical protein